MDNSLSITDENKDKIRQILTAYIHQKDENEEISIAVFTKEINYLAKNEKDTNKLLEALDQVTYKNDDSYLTDILYDELIQLENKYCYTRFIIASDGVDNKSIGYTKEELNDYLKCNNYLVYSLGCVYKENQQELENLFALSRLTNGSYYLFEDYAKFDEIIQALSEPIYNISMKIPDKCKDGSSYSVLISIDKQDGTVSLNRNAQMPFGLEQIEKDVISETQMEESALDSEVSTADSSMINSEVSDEFVLESTEPEQGNQESSVDILSILAILVVVLALIVQVIIKFTKKGNCESKEKKKREKKGKTEEADQSLEEAGTVMIDIDENSDKTMFLAGNMGSYLLILDDLSNGKQFKYPLINDVVIGRKIADDVNITINYDNSVSSKHSRISCYNGEFCIEDMGAANKTRLNGNAIEGSVKIKSGDVIQLGRV